MNEIPMFLILALVVSNLCNTEAYREIQGDFGGKRGQRNGNGGCLNYGHSCLGAHGKREDSISLTTTPLHSDLTPSPRILRQLQKIKNGLALLEQLEIWPPVLHSSLRLGGKLNGRDDYKANLKFGDKLKKMPYKHFATLPFQTSMKSSESNSAPHYNDYEKADDGDDFVKFSFKNAVNNLKHLAMMGKQLLRSYKRSLENRVSSK